MKIWKTIGTVAIFVMAGVVVYLLIEEIKRKKEMAKIQNALDAATDTAAVTTG